MAYYDTLYKEKEDEMKFEISGTVQEAETGSGAPGVIVSAFDKRPHV